MSNATLNMGLQPVTPSARRAGVQLVVATAIGIASSAVYTLFSLRQWMRFESPSWDLGIFTQLAKAYSSFSAPIVPIKGYQFNLLGDHFHPLLVLLGPIYAAFPSGLTLLVVQNVLFGVTVAIITHSAIQHLGLSSGTSIGLALALSWGLQTAVEAQFHEVAFALPLLAMALSSFLSERWTSAALWAAPLVFVKEDLGVTVAVLGALLAFRTRKPAGIWLAVWGIGWTVFAVAVVIPAFNTTGSYAYGLVSAGTDPLAAFLNDLLATQKFETLALLVVISAGLALRSPLALLALPTLAWRMLSTNENYWGTRWHYSAILMPIVFAAAIDGARKLRDYKHPSMRKFARAAPFAALAVALLLLPFFPLRVLFSSEPLEASPRDETTREVLALVPDGSTVETDVTLMAYLVPRSTVYWWGNPGNPPPDYVVLDTRSGSWTNEYLKSSAAAFADGQYPGIRYKDLYLNDGYQVAVRLP